MNFETQQDVNSAVEVMRPKPSPFRLIRVGGEKDGGYLLPDDFDGIQACFSPGVQNRKDFEDELSGVYGIACHMCDFSSDPNQFRTPLMENQTFLRKWLDTDGSSDSIGLEEWVLEKSPAPEDDLILQIDIEGAEYRNILNCPESILKRFRIIVIELHHLQACQSPTEFSEEIGPLLAVFDKYFTCIHAHPNNCGGDIILPESNLNIPRVLELTLIRTDRLRIAGNSQLIDPQLPHPQDITRNYPRKAPLHLNEAWLEPKTRSLESQIKILTEEILYLKDQRKKLECSDDLIVQMRKLTEYSASRANINRFFYLGRIKGGDEISEGKSYTLSSKHGVSPQGLCVREGRPFFFHTNFGKNEHITIDLGVSYQIYRIEIKNRSNGYGERASCLYYSVHDLPEPDLNKGLPISTPYSFLSGKLVSTTYTGGQNARYVTIFSPQKTALHFSDIKIYGVLKNGTISRAKYIAQNIIELLCSTFRSCFTALQFPKFHRKVVAEKFIIIPKSGLANRLMALLSCWRIADSLGVEFEVFWEPSKALHARFEDLFQNEDIICYEKPEASPIDRDSATIRSRGEAGGKIYPEELCETIVVRSNSFLCLSHEPRGGSFLDFGPLGPLMKEYFKRLKVNPDIMRIVDDFTREHSLGDGCGVHVRWGVGDSPKWQEKHQEHGLEPYMRKIRSILSKGGKETILIVSDSAEVRSKMIAEFGSRVILSPASNFNRSTSTSAARDSLLDFLLLVRCKWVLSKNSSFSYLAAYLGDAEYINVLKD